MKPLLTLLLLTLSLFANIPQGSFSSDEIGSILKPSDSSEQITDSYDYTPYRELLRHTGSSDTPPSSSPESNTTTKQAITI